MGSALIACGSDSGDNSGGTVRVNKIGGNIPVVDETAPKIDWPDPDCRWTVFGCDTLTTDDVSDSGVSDLSDGAVNQTDSGEEPDAELGMDSSATDVDGGSDASVVNNPTDGGSVVSESGSNEEIDSGTPVTKCTVPLQVFKNHGMCVSYCAHTYLKRSLQEHSLFVECKNDCDCAYSE